MMRRLALLLVLVAACAGGDTADTTTAPEAAQTTSTLAATTTTPPTTTTAAPTTTTLSPEEVAAARYEADVARIEELWRGYSDATLAGGDAAVQYLVDHSYPPLGCTFDDLSSPNPPADRTEEVVVDPATIERDDDWVIPAGPEAGEKPAGRVYVYTIDVTSSIGPGASGETRSTVIGGDAYFLSLAERCPAGS